MDNVYNIYRALKDKNQKYLVRIYWVPEEKWFKNAKYMHKWYLVEV